MLELGRDGEEGEEEGEEKGDGGGKRGRGRRIIGLVQEEFRLKDKRIKINS